MRKSYSTQLRLDSVPIEKVELNLKSRDSLVPILRALQFVYCDRDLTDTILGLIAGDVNADTRRDTGRPGMADWHLCVLAAVRLGCNYTYDQLQDLSENHRKLRAIMGLGDCDPTEFKWRTIRNNLCLLRPQTIEQISLAIAKAGHALAPEAIEKVRADSFVLETCIHYPTESSLLYDGLRKIISLSVLLAEEHGVTGWRQHRHLLKKVKQLNRKINRIVSKKGPHYTKRMLPHYRELLGKSALLTQRARDLLTLTGQPQASITDLFGANTLQSFIVRTERVADTATRRVLHGETVPNSDKLFSIFEPHTQLYKRGKAGQPIQFGRQVLMFEDAAGFLVRGSLMGRDQGDKEVAVDETKALQQEFGNRIKRLSFDRGFHSPGKPAVAQQAEADDEFLSAQQNHPGIESVIGALQRGNSLKRCRDRSELGFERYIQLAMLGRNLHTLGRLLIAQENAQAPAGQSLRQGGLTTKHPFNTSNAHALRKKYAPSQPRTAK